MKRLVILLLLAGCDSQKPTYGGGGEAAETPPLPRGALTAESLAGQSQSPEETARLQSRIMGAMSGIMKDPESARYSNVRSGTAGAICGEVEALGTGLGSAGFRPFVITPSGAAMISATAEVRFNDALDSFSDSYIRWCATPEELERIEPLIQAPASTLPPPPPAGALDAGPALIQPDQPTARREPDPAPARPAPPPNAGAGDEDSFAKAVIRNREEPPPGK